MIEIQCTSCQTRYRIDEGILPEDTPTFKCSRCGHVFSAEPRKPRTKRPAADKASAAQPAAPFSPNDDTPAAKDTFADAAAAPDIRGDAQPLDPATQSTQDEPPRSEAAAIRPDESESSSEPSDVGQPAPGVLQRSSEEPSGEIESPAPAQAPRSPQAAPQESSASRHSTEELLSLRFSEAAKEATEGENLSFDFSDERSAQEEPDASEPRARADAEEKWEVGEEQPSLPPAAPSRPIRRIRIDEVEQQDDDPPFNAEEISAAAHRLEKELRSKSHTVHSAGFFIALFALVTFGFGILSMLICGAPIASASLLGALPVVGESLKPMISPAERVALSGVQAQYTAIKGDQHALVISGTAENVSPDSLGAVQIRAALVGPAQRTLRVQAVYCGNKLSQKMIGEMTPRELEFFEKLNAPKGFRLASQASAPFVIVFIEPPTDASRFQLRVTKADTTAAASAKD